MSYRIRYLFLDLIPLKNKLLPVFNMKKLSAFVKTSIVGGALVLVPLLILYMLISELVELIIALVFPILELLPGNFVDWFGDPVFPAIVVLLTISFLVA